MNAMTSAEPAVYALAQLNLDTGSRVLAGPRGEMRLADRRFRLMECLMRRPGMLVSTSTLISAMYDQDEADENQQDPN